jgi:hypothetical protein
MALTLIKSKSLDEELEEIEIPIFDIIVHDEETWFERMIDDLEKANNSTKYEQN